MKFYFILFILTIFSNSSYAKESLKKYRGNEEFSTALFSLVSNEPEEVVETLTAVGEKIYKRKQMLGDVSISNTWKQTIYDNNQKVIYAAGEVYEVLPTKTILSTGGIEFKKVLVNAKKNIPALKSASKIFKETQELAQNSDGIWIPYWRVEYLSKYSDELRYIHISKLSGKVIEEGKIPWDGADGRAYVFPKGPKLSELEEATLYNLLGDGTVTGRLIKVFSSLDIKVWSPELNFFFAQNDRRFDLGQAYYIIDQGFSWMKNNLEVELPQQINVQLHVGKDGVSNAAFYHQNHIYLGSGDGQIYKDMLKDPTILIHEAMHAIIDLYVGLPSEGEGGGFNEGFADLFTALILDTPRMGENSYLKAPFRRTLENKLIAFKDFAPGVYQNGSIVGATFWDMKGELGNKLTAKLAFKTLVRLGAGARFEDFYPSLVSACADLLSSEQKEFVLEKAKARGWK
ncbi:MAG: hypothetical protein M9962_09685 [Oligoflexia bacterium]|nr:hypothetical protein [Oligoflexia bacterium]